MKNKVFLSYAGTDAQFAQRLTLALQAKGISAVSESDIRPGENWQEQLRQELTAADLVAVILTDAALHSRFVLAELGAAWANDKPIFAIQRSAKPDLSELPLPSNTIQHLQADKLSEAAIAEALQQRLAA